MFILFNMYHSLKGLSQFDQYIIPIMKYLLAVILVVNCLSWSIIQTKQTALKQRVKFDRNLGFNNNTSECITKDQVTKAVNIINDAATLFGADVYQNMQYIKNQLNINYGKQESHFTVYVMTERKQNWYSVISKHSCSYIELGTVNKKYPNWSYLIVQNTGLPEKYINSTGFAKGSGISSDFLKVINNIIKTEEGTLTTCDCSAATTSIAQKLHNQDDQFWSVVCTSSLQSLFWHVAPVKDQWTLTSGSSNGCAYAVHVTTFQYCSPSQIKKI